MSEGRKSGRQEGRELLKHGVLNLLVEMAASYIRVPGSAPSPDDWLQLSTDATPGRRQ